MNSGKLLGVLIVLAHCRLDAQDLPPETQLLARVKAHMREELSHLPNYTCLETIARFHTETERMSNSRFPSKMKPLDIARLEIVYSNHHEWYGSPGGRRFITDRLVSFIGSGMIGDGAFAMAANNIFGSEAATFKYRGEGAVGDRRAAIYDYRLSRLTSGLRISLIGGSGTVGEQGSFWIDPQSLDLLRLEIRAGDIPPFLPLEELSMIVRYARTRIGRSDVLLPLQADLRTAETHIGAAYDRFEFTHCRAFEAQSTIHFEQAQDSGKDATEGSGVLAVPSGTRKAVPALLKVVVQLETPITEKDTVGNVIEGRVLGDVRHKGKIVIPDASLVHGRIRRLERSEGRGSFIVGVEFTDVEANGEPLIFYADLLSMERRPGIRRSVSEQIVEGRGVGHSNPDQEISAFELPGKAGIGRSDSEQISVSGGVGQPSREEQITLPELPGVAAFFVSGTTFTIPSGFRLVWRTRGLIR